MILIFANPFSGSGENRRRVAELDAALNALGVETEIVWDAEQRIPTLRGLSSGSDENHVVVAAGGDGSIADVINDMHAAGRLGLPFATLPVGNENLFAQEFGFTARIDALAAAIVRGDTRAIDLAQVRSAPPDAADARYADDPAPAEDPQDTPPATRLFTLMASAGFDAEVIHRLDRWRKNLPDGQLHRVNRQRYLPRILETIRGYDYPGFILETDDGQAVPGHQAYVFNIPRYGGGFNFAPDARADDGQLDWVVFQKPGFLHLLLYHGWVVLGRHRKLPSVTTGRSASVTLKSAKADTPGNQPAPGNQSAPVQADGDPAGTTRLEFTVLPRALHVIQMMERHPGSRGR